MRSLLPTPSHRAASAAKEKGFGGPVRRRRKTGTLYDIAQIATPIIKTILYIRIKGTAKMNDYEKNRINYAIALFAASLAISSLVTDSSIYQPSVKIKDFLLFFNILMGVTVYFYSLSFFGINKVFHRTKRVADIIYRVTIFLPLLYFLYFGVSFLDWYYEKNGLIFIGTSAAPITNDILYNILFTILLLIICLLIGTFGYDLANAADKRNRNRSSNISKKMND